MGLKENRLWFLDNLKNAVRGLLFMGESDADNKNIFWYVDPLSNFQGGGDYKNGLLQSLVDQGNEAVITPEMEEIIFFGSFN